MVWATGREAGSSVMEVKTAALESQPKVELSGNGGAGLQSGPVIPWELAGDMNEGNR